ncbi:alpha/beta fold hydrolase [Streptomyces sp. NPDC046876]|uniref:alpha/beta fold hydrolase n=1 Tax=Streptomyces sp. NPDC046876 TaxID=3155616 RepID=UPI0033CA4F3D
MTTVAFSSPAAAWNRRASQARAPGGPTNERTGIPDTAHRAWFVEGRPAGFAPVTVAYERHGQGLGEPLVLLHGAGHHRRAWDPVLPTLSEAHETIALDLPGFGESPDLHPSLSRDLTTTVAWMESVFASLGIERPHLVAHSLGGLIALRLAQAGLARTVTAIAPAGFWTEAERRYAYAVLIMARQGARLLPQTGKVPVPPESLSPPNALNGRLVPRGTEALIAELCTLRQAAAFKETLRAGRAPHLFSGDIPGAPVTIGWGSRDRLLPPWQAQRVKAAIPGARLVTLPGCGHVPMADAPELVARVLLEATSPPPADASSRNFWRGTRDFG